MTDKTPQLRRRIVETTAPSRNGLKPKDLPWQAVASWSFWGGWALGVLVNYYLTSNPLSSIFDWIVLLINGVLFGLILAAVATVPFIQRNTSVQPDVTIITEEYGDDGELVRRRVIPASINNQQTAVDMDGKDWEGKDFEAAAVAIIVHGASISKWGLYDTIKGSPHNLKKLSQQRCQDFADMLHEDEMATKHNINRAGWNWLRPYVPGHVTVTTPPPRD
jgi:hypothetical protein